MTMTREGAQILLDTILAGGQIDITADEYWRGGARTYLAAYRGIAVNYPANRAKGLLVDAELRRLETLYPRPDGVYTQDDTDYSIPDTMNTEDLPI